MGELRLSNNYFGMAISITLILVTGPYIFKAVLNPVGFTEAIQNFTDYYEDPDYFTIQGKIIELDYLEAGNWPFRSKITQVQLDTGHIILVKGWENGIILNEKYEFGYEKNMSGEYDLDYPDYVDHIRSLTNKEDAQ